MEPLETRKKTNSLPIVGGVIVFILVVGGFFLLKAPRSKNLATDNSSVEAANTSLNGPVKEFTVKGINYSFSPSTITVNKGDVVKVNFIDEDGTHNLIIDGYNIGTQTVRGGGQDSFQFVANKTGAFNFYCGVAGHRELGMQGTLIVN